MIIQSTKTLQYAQRKLKILSVNGHVQSFLDTTDVWLMAVQTHLKFTNYGASR